MKFILSLILFVITFLGNYAYCVTPIDSDEFEGNYFNTSCINAPQNVNCLYGNWYLDYIGMNYIYQNDFNLYPNFTVAVLDTAVDLNHEDLDFNIVRDISEENGISLRYSYESFYSYHGNLVTSLFSAGKIGNGLGGRGIVNAKTLFLSASSMSDVLNNQNQNESIGYNAESVLEGINRLLNPIPKDPVDGFTSPKIVSLSVGISPKTEIGTKRINFNQGEHFKATQPIRDYIEINHDVLFVMLAHNQSTDAKKSNGALHYKYVGDPNNEQEKLDENNYVLQKLPNLIIVAANGPDGVLHGLSNYGESVDITGPSGVYSSGCVKYSPLESTYHSVVSGEYYGYYFDDDDYSSMNDISLDSEDSPDMHKLCFNNGYASGTSSSQPITAGAAAILLARDETLTPTQIKSYLTQTPSLIKTALRYSSDVNSFDKLGNLCPGMPYADSCTIRTPILNIEKSMKQYEAEHTIVEDFEGDLYSLFNYARLKQYVSENNITYFATQNKYIDFYPSPNPLVANKCIRFRLISYLGAGDIFINSGKRLKKVFIRYTIYESRPNKYFGIYDENNNQVYYDNSIKNFGNFEEATFYIQDGTNSLRFSGDVDAMHIDKIEYTYQ